MTFKTRITYLRDSCIAHRRPRAWAWRPQLGRFVASVAAAPAPPTWASALRRPSATMTPRRAGSVPPDSRSWTRDQARGTRARRTRWGWPGRGHTSPNWGPRSPRVGPHRETFAASTPPDRTTILCLGPTTRIRPMGRSSSSSSSRTHARTHAHAHALANLPRYALEKRP